MDALQLLTKCQWGLIIRLEFLCVGIDVDPALPAELLDSWDRLNDLNAAITRVVYTTYEMR